MSVAGALPGLFPEVKEEADGAGAAVVKTDSASEAAWRSSLSPAHRSVMTALDVSGVLRMLDVRPTYMCPVTTCRFHCNARSELLEHFRNEHVTKKSLLQSVTATTAALEGSIAKISTDSRRTVLGMTRIPVPPPIQLDAEEDASDLVPPTEGGLPPGCAIELDGDGDGTILLKIADPPDGVVSAPLPSPFPLCAPTSGVSRSRARGGMRRTRRRWTGCSQSGA